MDRKLALTGSDSPREDSRGHVRGNLRRVGWSGKEFRTPRAGDSRRTRVQLRIGPATNYVGAKTAWSEGGHFADWPCGQNTFKHIGSVANEYSDNYNGD